MHIKERQKTAGEVVEARQMDVARSHVARFDICKHAHHAVVVGRIWTKKVAYGPRCKASFTGESGSASATTFRIASGGIGDTEVTFMFRAFVARAICPR